MEAALNNDEASLGVQLSDPSAILQLVSTSLQNSAKVLPNIEGLTDINLLEYPQTKEKVDDLIADLEQTKKDAANQIGIPDELVQGESNRWEVISRSSRFLTLIESLLEEITRCVKDTVVHRIHFKFNKRVDPNNVHLNLDTTNYLFNSNFNTKSQVVREKFDSLSQIIRTIQELRESGLVEDEKLMDFVRTELKVLDQSLAEVIVDKIEKGEELNPDELIEQKEVESAEPEPEPKSKPKEEDEDEEESETTNEDEESSEDKPKE